MKNALKFDILEKIMCVLEVSKMATILHFYKTKAHLLCVLLATEAENPQSFPTKAVSRL